MAKQRSKRKGFTLIELMVVMALMAVLSTLIIGAIVIVRREARNAKRMSDARTFRAALEAYHATYHKYPSTCDHEGLVDGSSTSIYDNRKGSALWWCHWLLDDNPEKSTSRAKLDPYLENFPATDPSGVYANPRIRFCPIDNNRYSLYILNEPRSSAAAEPDWRTNSCRYSTLPDKTNVTDLSLE